MTAQTSIRVDTDTLDALRIARGEIIAATRQPINSDDATVLELIRYWDLSKRDTHAVQSGPIIAPRQEN